MTSEVTTTETPMLPEKIEKALVDGDLSKLSTEERVEFYNATCKSLGLNPLTQPFGYITLNGKLRFYALRACTDQLRKIHGVTINHMRHEQDGDTYSVYASAQDKYGRQDEDLGAVTIKGLTGDALCNAKMKAVTKAKRRVTLSICGLSMLDETELETIPARAFTPLPAPTVVEAEAVEKPATITEAQATDIDTLLKDVGETEKRLMAWLKYGKKLEDIKADDYAKVVAKLEEKRGHAA